MIGMEMSQDEQRHGGHPKLIKASSHRSRVRPGVDHNGRAPTDAEHEPIALPDVTGDQDPMSWRPTGLRRHHQQDADQHPCQRSSKQGVTEHPAHADPCGK